MPSHHQVFWTPHGRFLKLLGPKKHDGFPNQNNQYLSFNLLHSYGKPPFLMKVNHHRSSINGPCSFAILNHQQATSRILGVVFEEPKKSSLDINFRCYEHASRKFQTLNWGVIHIPMRAVFKSLCHSRNTGWSRTGFRVHRL